MRKTFILVIITLISNYAEAQFIKEKSINAQIGYGISTPLSSVDNVFGRGFFAQGELILKATSWFELRPYAGFIFTSSNGKDIDDNPTNEKAVSNAFLLGGKARVRAPIPWVAPFIEIGIGGSIGKFETETAFDNIDKGGVIYHIPISFGLELGRNNNVDLAFNYYIQPSVEQYIGVIAVGVTIPLRNNK